MTALPMRFATLMVVFKHQRAALAVFLGVVLIGFLYLLLADKKYESSAELVVRFGGQEVADINRPPTTELTPSDRHEIVLSHAAILTSPDLAQATLKAVGVETVYPEVIADPPKRWSIMDEAVRRFANDLWVDVGAQDDVITVSFLHKDKVVAQKVVQKLIELYIGQQTVVYHDPHSDFLKREVADADKHLNDAQATLEQFKQKWQINDYDTEINDLLQQEGDVDTNLHQAQAALDQAVNRKSDLEKLMHDVPRNLPEPANGEKYHALDEAQARLADLKNKESQMLATYAPGSPAMVSLEAGIAAAEAEVRARRDDLSKRSAANVNAVYQTVQEDYLRTAADADSNAEPVRVLTQQKDAIDQRLADLRKNRGTYDDLVRQRQLAEEMYHTLSTEYEDARVKESLNQERISTVAIISQPSLPYKIARPRRLATLVITLFAGIILAIGTALLLEALDDSFTTSDQLALFLDVPILASFEHRRRSLPGLLPVHGDLK